MPEPLQSLAAGNAVHYGRIGGLWVMILHRPPVEADMLLAKGTLEKMTKAYPDGYPTLTWVLPSAGFSLDAASKEAAAKITSDFSESIRARATVIEGSGFAAASVRAIIAGIDLFSRTQSPGKVFSEVESALGWCQPFLSAKNGALPPRAASVLKGEVARLLGD